MAEAPWTGDACSLVDAFRAGERSPLEELDATLAAIERSDLNCFSFLDPERARQTAGGADVSLPFGGVPTGIKELSPVAGWPDTEASLVFKRPASHQVVPQSATAVRGRRGGAGRHDHRQRVRRAQRQRHEAQRRDPQPLAARPHGRGIVGWIRGRRRGRSRLARHRWRRWWFDPHPGRLQRAAGHEGHLRSHHAGPGCLHAAQHRRAAATWPGRSETPPATSTCAPGWIPGIRPPSRRTDAGRRNSTPTT